jgi:hypothetical protein
MPLFRTVQLAGNVPYATTISLTRGHTLHVVANVNDDNGAPLDLTGCSIEWVVRSTASSPTDIIHKKTADASLSISPDDKSRFSFTLSGADTAAMQAGSYYMEAAVTDDGSEDAHKMLLFSGSLAVSASIL